MEERKRIMSKSAFKKWVRKYSTYFILAGIILVSFFVGFLIGAISCRTSAVEAVEPSDVVIDKQAATKPAETIYPVEITAPTPVSVVTEPEITEPEVFYFNVPLSTELQDFIRYTSEEYGVPYELVYAIIQVESSFRPSVISSSNDYGLMQINKINHEWLKDELGLTDILDPYQNIQAGTYIIGLQLNATDGDLVLALMRYNCGASGARKLWEKGIYSTAYTDKVMAAYAEFCQQEKGQ
jgi:soluble lytic murein transglycosylase-like protein